MRRLELVLVLVVLATGTFIVRQAMRVQRERPTPTTVASAAAPSGDTVVTSPNERVVSAGALPAPERNIEGIRQHLREFSYGTYIGDILAARDSNIARWPERRTKPVTVWIDDRSPLAGPDQALAFQVRRAFDDWGVAGVPMVFNFVNDSAGADVKVTFIDHFERAMSGRTLWTRDPNWWIIAGDIQLSLRSGSGQLLTPEQVYSIALHEIGHLLGLDHTADTTAIMAPRVRVRTLAPADVATMKLIYGLPPGTVKAPRGGR